MTRLERYRAKLEEFRARRAALLRAGRYFEAKELSEKILEVEALVKQAEDYEEAMRPRPIRELISHEELQQMGIIPLMIEAHLAADFLTEVAYMISDICTEHGFKDIVFSRELDELIKKSDMFAGFLSKRCPHLTDMLVRNETFNASLHKKYLKYIEQRASKWKQEK